MSEDLSLDINWDTWERQPIFDIIQSTGNVPEEDMRKTFNLGIGLIFVVNENLVSKLIDLTNKYNYKSYNIGKII